MFTGLNKVAVLEKEGVAPYLEVESSSEVIEFLNYFIHFTNLLNYLTMMEFRKMI